MSFYRYFKFEDSLKTLSSLCLRMSDPRHFNDPFEFNPVIDLSNITYDKATVYFGSEKGLEGIYREKGTKEPYTQFKENFLKTELKGFVNKWLDNRHVHEEKMSFQSALCPRFNVVCGSFTPLSILMWSHYAEKHSGVVIEFNQNESPFSRIQRIGRLINVNYEDKRPLYKFGFDHSELELLEKFNQVARTKYTCWGYEKEVRAVLPVGDDIVKTRVIKKLDDHYYLSITPRSISSVIMGSRIENTSYEALRGILNQEFFKHIQLKKCFLSKSKFELEIE